MAKFNKYIQIGQPIDSGQGVDAGMVKVASQKRYIIVMLEDVGMPGLQWFQDNSPERILECGIAEANAAVVAGALAAEGFIPILNGFTFAVVERAYNQIRQSILVDRFNVKIMGRDGVWGEMGVSHDIVEGIGCTVFYQIL